MDKLEPILKQKFWILLGTGLIMTIVGWWMAAGALAKTITDRKGVLDKVESVIPTGPVANNDWAAKLSEINVRQEALVNVARRELWERQKARMVWPQNVGEFAEKIPYEGEFDIVASENYRLHYLADAERVWKIVRPFNLLDGTGIVQFPFQKFPMQVSGNIAPSSKEMWSRQQDLWLLEPIMEAIRNVNGGESGTRLDAAVHLIDKLQLMGGNRDAVGSTAGGQMGTDEAGMDNMATAIGAGMEGSALGGFGSGGSGSGGGQQTVSADFDPKEEIGDGGSLTGGGGQGAFGGMSSVGAAEDSAETDDGSGQVSAGSNYRHYVDDEEGKPYKTRAFYLSVLMDHQRLPDLLGQLTANGESAWPIEIVRVQVVRVNPDAGTGSGVGSGGPMAGLGGLGGVGALSGESSFGGASSPFGGGASLGGASPLNSGVNFSNPGAEFSGEDDGAAGIGYGQRGAGGSAGGFDAAFADPSLARVAILGLIYIYKPVDPPPASDPATPTEEAPTAAPAEGATPTEGTEPAASPTEAPADPNVPQPATETPATPSDPAAPTTPEPAATESPPAATDSPAPAGPPQ
jgi:hypothetical protein